MFDVIHNYAIYLSLRHQARDRSTHFINFVFQFLTFPIFKNKEGIIMLISSGEERCLPSTEFFSKILRGNSLMSMMAFVGLLL